MYQLVTASPIGLLTLEGSLDAVTALRFGDTAEAGAASSPPLEEAWRQLEEYFAGQRREFDLPLSPAGTAFQQKVWAALRAIPYGGTASYGEIAARVGNPQARRAVGMANNRNPLPILIPCHRVLGADGSLTGYAGGLEVKRFLLALEGAAAG